MNETQKLISEFNKSSIEIVKIISQEWKGKPYIDLRIWIMQNPAEPESAKPTHKGLTLDIELLPKLIDALNETSRILKERETEKTSPKKKE